MAPDYALDDISYCEDRFSNPEDMNVYPGARYDMKVSMYLEYAAPPVHYTRTLAQGVMLTDTRKLSGDYKRKHITAINVSDTVNRFRGFFRSVAEHLQATGLLNYCRDFVRTIALTLRSLTEGTRSLSARRNITTEANTQDNTARQRGFIRTLLAGVTAGDYTEKIFTLLRTVREEAAVSGEAGHLGDYLRGLYTEAGSRAETGHAGEYHRRVQDAAGGTAVSLRHLFIFLRLATLSLVRDYITGRFLRSKEELVIKSLVCRELTLESTLH
jgi:hypothetical protein